MKLKLFKTINNYDALIEALDQIENKFGFGIKAYMISKPDEKYAHESESIKNHWVEYREHARLTFNAIITGIPYYFKNENYYSKDKNIAVLKEQNYLYALPESTIEHLYNNTNTIYKIFDDESYARVSNENVKMVSIFRNKEMAEKDKRTTIKFGRWLYKYLGYTDNELIKALNTAYDIEVQFPRIKIAHSKESIIHVYENGPNSCMCRKGWTSNDHPVGVYEHPDLCLAYLEKANGYSARAIIRTDKENPEYIRIYGDIAKMQRAFSVLGIEQSPDGLLGIEFKVPEKAIIKMPYFDGSFTALFAKNRTTLKVVNNTNNKYKVGELSYATDTGGTIVHPMMHECYITGTSKFKDEMFPIHTSDGIRYVTLEGIISDSASLIKEVKRITGQPELWFYNSLDRHPYINGEYIHGDDLEAFGYILHKGEYIHKDDKRVAICANTGKIELKDNMLKWKDKYYTDMNFDFDAFLNITNGRIYKRKPKGQDAIVKSITEIREELKGTYGLPIYDVEVKCEYPKISNLSHIIAYTTNHPSTSKEKI